MMKGYRTYTMVGLMVLVGVGQQYLAGHTVLTRDITDGLMVVFGSLAAYFRSKA